MRRGLIVAFACLSTPVYAQNPARWFIIETADGKRIGRTEQLITPVGTDGARLVRDQTLSRTQEAKSAVRLQRETTVRLEQVGGMVSSITQTNMLDKTITTLSAKFTTPGVAIIERIAGDDRRYSRIPLPADLRFDNGAGLLRGWDRAAGTQLRYSALNLAAPQIEQVVIDQPAAQANGQTRARRQLFDQGQLRSVSWITLDGAGRIIRTEAPMFGTMAITREVKAAEALTKHPPFSLVRNAMVKAPFRVPQSAMTAHIRYRFAFREGVTFEAPTTGEQRARIEGDALIVDICKTCGDQATILSAEDRARFLAPTKWMQSDHPTFKAIAGPIAIRSISDADKIKMLSGQVAQRLERIDFAGHVTALEAWQRRRWDCTEEAAILATLARAAGIPARVASGLVYSRERYHGVSNVFMPHAWTLVYVDGRWQSFDVSIGQFDSTHIAFTLGDGDSRSMAAGSMLAGLTTMNDMAEVRRRMPTP